MAIKVKAIQLGYYGNQRRKPGDVFFIKNEQLFSKIWMKKLKAGDEDELEDEEDEDHEDLDAPALNEFGKKAKGPKKKKQKPEPESEPSDESVI